MATQPESSIGNRDIQQYKLPEYTGNSLVFEGVHIQMDKGQWVFGEGKNAHTIDTYSIWNPKYHDEVATRLAQGERCAMYIMGNFGIGQIIESPEWITPKSQRAIDELFEIKKRDSNFVAFLDPDDAANLIDFDRLPAEHRNLKWAGNRHRTYAGPQHNIFPIRENGLINDAVMKVSDKSMAIFWIPGHWGYEEIAKKLRKKVKHGIFGGGSLNIHEQEPSYTTKELYAEISRQPFWQERIHFILFDELAEAGRIGRSQTMVKFTTYPPKIHRVGSLSSEAISMRTGHEILLDKEGLLNGNVKRASSLTQYNRGTNETSDKRVKEVMDRIERYKNWYQ